MKLYHGTVYDIENIDLSKSNSAKDSGKGFYLSTYKLELLEEYYGDRLTEKDLCNHGFSGGRSLETPNCNNKKLLDYIKSII